VKTQSLFATTGRARHAPGQRGQTAVLLAVMLPALLAIVGLMVDGSRLLIMQRRAQIAIDSAAFAAAQRIDRGRFFYTQSVQLNAIDAISTGSVYGTLNSQGSVRVTSISVYGNRVVALGYAEVEPIFLKMFGVQSVTINLSSSAVPAFGIQREQQ
jgi:uncharacterized membrane protein